MSEPVNEAANSPPPAFGPVGRALFGTSRVLAIAGALILAGLIAMSIVSIVGRKIASTPVPGDVEVLQMLAAVAGACFFAYCHLANGDVKVDFFTARLPQRAQAALDAFGSLLMTAFGLLIAWRSFAGAMSLREVGETSAILGWPVWIAQLLMVPGFALLAAAGAYMAVHRLRTAAGKP